MSDFNLDELNSIVSARAGESSDKSYTASLLEKGTPTCARKFGEEALETVIAALSGNKDELVSETADTLYHLLVLLKSEKIELSDVMEELGSRTGMSGHEEKASR